MVVPRSLWFSLSFDSSIICFISSALGAIELAAGLVGLEAVVVVVFILLAGLLRLGAVGATEGLWANATEAVAAKIVTDLSKFIGLMWRGFWEGKSRRVKLAGEKSAFLLIQQS